MDQFSDVQNEKFDRILKEVSVEHPDFIFRMANALASDVGYTIAPVHEPTEHESLTVKNLRALASSLGYGLVSLNE